MISILVALVQLQGCRRSRRAGRDLVASVVVYNCSPPRASIPDQWEVEGQHAHEQGTRRFSGNGEPGAADVAGALPAS